MVDGNSSKLLSCEFHDEILCSYRKSERVLVMYRCYECRHYWEFAGRMDRFEDEFFEEVERLERKSVGKRKVI